MHTRAPVTATEAPVRVLLAEDHADLRALLAQALTAAGCVVIQVDSGIALVDRMQAMRRQHEAPDVIVTDLRMPGMSGLAAIEVLRDAEWRLPIVLMTAFDDEWAREEAARLEIAAMVRKPVDAAQLHRLVTQLAHAG